MVLVRVVALVREDEIGIDFLLQFFESRLYFGAYEGHEAVGKFLEHEPLDAAGTGKQIPRLLRLCFADAR